MKKLLSLFLIIIATLCLAIALPACKKEEEVEVVPFVYGFISEEELGDEEITEVSADKLNADASFMVGASKYLVIDYIMKPQDGSTYTYKVTVSPIQNVRPKIHSAKTTMTSDNDSGNAKTLTATFNAPEADKKERLVVELVPTQEGELKISCQILADDQPTEYSFNLTKKIALRPNSGGSTGGQEEVTQVGLSYSLNEDKKSYSVAGIGFEKGDYIYVPGNYEGLPVTGILDNAFKNATFVEVTIADGIKKIGRNAFSGCEKLVSASIGTGLEEIGESAFKGCRLIRGINLAETLQSIGNSAFSSPQLNRF